VPKPKPTRLEDHFKWNKTKRASPTTKMIHPARSRPRLVREASKPETVKTTTTQSACASLWCPWLRLIGCHRVQKARTRYSQTLIRNLLCKITPLPLCTWTNSTLSDNLSWVWWKRDLHNMGLPCIKSDTQHFESIVAGLGRT
jgi:hypothetical protein